MEYFECKLVVRVNWSHQPKDENSYEDSLKLLFPIDFSIFKICIPLTYGLYFHEFSDTIHIILVDFFYKHPFYSEIPSIRISSVSQFCGCRCQCSCDVKIQRNIFGILLIQIKARCNYHFPIDVALNGVLIWICVGKWKLQSKFSLD